MKTDNIKLASDLLPKDKNGLRWTQLLLIPALLACLAGPFIGKDMKKRVSGFSSSGKKERSLFVPLLAQAKIEEGDKEKVDTIIHIPQVYGENFDKVGAIDKEHEQAIVEKIVTEIQKICDKNSTIYGPFPGFDGMSWDFSSGKVDILSIEGGSSAENYSKQELNNTDDAQNLELAEHRANNFSDILKESVKKTLENEGKSVHVEDVKISGKVNSFTNEELVLLESISSKYSENKNSNDELNTLSFLHKYHHNQIENITLEDKQRIDAILDSKRTVKIVIRVNDGISTTTYNFLILPFIVLFYGLFTMMRLGQLNKSSKLRSEIYNALEKGKNVEWIQKNIINKNKD